VADFFGTVPAGGRLDLIPVLRIAANGHPAAYLPDGAGSYEGYGVIVFTVEDGAIDTITGLPPAPA
jgi:hypothetical protein